MTSFSYEEAFGEAPQPSIPLPKASKSSSSFSYEDAFNLPPEVRKPRSEADIALGGVAAGARAVGSELASLGDMILNTPSSVAGIGANIVRRVGGAVKGEERGKAAEAGRTLQERIEATAPNLLKKFISLVPIPGVDPGSTTHVEKAMGALIEWTDRDAQAMEDRSGGAIKKEDVQLLRDSAMSVLGMKGITIPTKALVKRAGEKALDEMPAPAPTLEVVPPPAAPRPGVRANVEASTGIADTATRISKQGLAIRRADVRAAFEADPGYADYMRNLVEEDVRQASNLTTRPQRLVAAEGVTAPRAPPSEATILRRDGTPDTTLIGQRSLDTGLTKVVQGRSFALTAAEKVAIRGNAKAWGGLIEKGAVDSDLLAAMGVAGVGTALAMAYPDEAKDLITAAAGAGIFFSGNMRELGRMADASPMSALLANTDTTLKTLERLPQNHSVYKKTLVEEQLKRPDVTKAEKDVMQAVLDSVPGEVITPKQLVAGFKKETGAWELTKVETPEYANYGLENIGRDPWKELLPPDQQGRPRENNALDAIEMEANPDVGAVTHVYRLPEQMQMSAANHFDDPQYFGHTRVLKEDGIRHVVEVQSDLAQHAGKVLTPEEYTKTLKEQNVALKQKTVFDEVFLSNIRSLDDYGRMLRNTADELKVLDPEFKGRIGSELAVLTHQLHPSSKVAAKQGTQFFDDFVDNLRAGYLRLETTGPLIEEVLSRESRKSALRVQELEIKLNSAAIGSQLAPLIKNWPKRLIREELAGARGAGEPLVRFATADTVAKVEGWPDIQQNFDKSWGLTREWIARNGSITARPTQRFSDQHQSIYDRYNKDISKFLRQLGGRDYTDPLGNTWIEVPTAAGGQRMQMFGRADADLLKTMGAAGAGAVVGAYLMGKEDTTGAILGAAGGLMGRYAASRSVRVRKAAETLAKGADYAGGLVSTRVKNISEPIHHRLVEHERQIFRDGHKQLTAVAPFIEALGKVKGEARRNLAAAILTNDPVAIRNAMASTRIPGLASEWRNVRNLLDEMGKENIQNGLLKNLRQDYYPRIVKDVDGLLEHLGAEQKTLLEKKLAQAERQASAIGSQLSPEARSAIINEEMAKTTQGGSGKASFRKPRSIDEVTKELLPFYESPVESLTGYIRSSAREQAKARFFGRDLVKDTDGSFDAVNIDKSVGALVDRELQSKAISFKDAEELKNLIRSRFVDGDRASNVVIQDVKNLGYTSLLGQLTSALVQLSDVGQTVFTQGLLPTMEAVVAQLRGKSISVKEMGLLDHVAEELASTRGTAKVLNSILKLVVFAAIDRFVKNNAVTAALIKNERLAQTTKGQADIRARYQEAFGPDFPQLLEDLKARKQTDLVDSLLFSELSRQQPISKIEVPQAYLDNPNLRSLYMLKTFALKQVDLARRDAYNEIKKGNITKGTKNLIGLGLLWGVAGATNGWVRDWILGREFEPKAEDVWKNLFKTFGWSDYTLEKAAQGRPIAAALGTIAPPIGIIDDTLGTVQKVAGDDVKKPSDLKGVSNIPVVGRILYNRGLGGAEDASKKRRAKERREARQRRAEARRSQ